MKIIGISGKKQGGKSFLAKNLCSIIADNSQRQGLARDCDYKIVRMADALKQVVIDCFVPTTMGISQPDDLDSDEVKDTELPCGMTIRHLLQQIGTDMFRNGLWHDVWINAWLRKVAWLEDCIIELPFVICPDVRFPNELKAIHDLGGVVIRLTRAPFADVDQHESETALDDAAKFAGNMHKVQNKFMGGFDYVMDNKDFSMPDARRWAKDFVAENYPDYV